MGLSEKEQQGVAEQLRQSWTVKDLNKWLEQLPESLPLATIGHFGEFNAVAGGSFTVAECSVSPEGDWRSGVSTDVSVVNVTGADIGADPDGHE